MNKDKFSDALPILQNLNDSFPFQVRYAFRLAKCFDGLGRIDEASEIIEKIINYEETEVPKIRELNRTAQIKELEQAGKEIPDHLKEPIQTENKREYPQLLLLKGTLELAKKNYAEALDTLQKAEKTNVNLPQLHQQIGFVYLKMRRIADAERTFIKALENDPENPQAHYGMALVYFRKKDYELSINYSLNAVGLLYRFPRAHLILGMALAKLQLYDRSIEAFRIVLTMSPGMVAAHKYLVYIYEFQLHDKAKADEHIDAIKKLRETNPSGVL